MIASKLKIYAVNYTNIALLRLDLIYYDLSHIFTKFSEHSRTNGKNFSCFEESRIK